MKKILLLSLSIVSAALLGATIVYLKTNIQLGFITLGVLVFLLLIIMVNTYVDYRRHRRPLVMEDPSVPYTFSHHVRQVSIPIFRYRLSLALHSTKPTSIKRF